MKGINAIFRHGHFYDPETEKRILIREGAKAVLVVDPKDIRHLPEAYPGQIRSAYQQVKDLKDQKSVRKAKLLMARGGKLVFDMNCRVPVISKWGKKAFIDLTEEEIEASEEYQKHTFEVELLEDLYLYWSEKEKSLLGDCACMVKVCLSNNLEYFEPVFGKSLAEVFRRTAQQYFAFRHSGSGNAFGEFKVWKGWGGETLDEIRKRVDFRSQEQDYDLHALLD